MSDEAFELRPIGRVVSPLRSAADAPLQADEGAPEAWLEIFPWVAAALEGLTAGDEIVVLTWLHLGDRNVRQVHPRGDPSRPVRGVFGTRSPHRPNPIGLHRVRVLDVDDRRVRVAALEAIDGTPIVDIKAVLGSADR